VGFRASRPTHRHGRSRLGPGSLTTCCSRSVGQSPSRGNCRRRERPVDNSSSTPGLRRDPAEVCAAGDTASGRSGNNVTLNDVGGTTRLIAFRRPRAQETLAALLRDLSRGPPAQRRLGRPGTPGRHRRPSCTSWPALLAAVRGSGTRASRSFGSTARRSQYDPKDGTRAASSAAFGVSAQLALDWCSTTCGALAGGARRRRCRGAARQLLVGAATWNPGEAGAQTLRPINSCNESDDAAGRRSPPWPADAPLYVMSTPARARPEPHTRPRGSRLRERGSRRATWREELATWPERPGRSPSRSARGRPPALD